MKSEEEIKLAKDSAAEGGLKVSMQYMYVDSSVLAGYQTSAAMAGAANSYGGINAQAAYLQPRAGRVTVTPAVVPAGGSGSGTGTTGTGTTDSGDDGSTEPSGGGNDNPPAGDDGDEG